MRVALSISALASLLLLSGCSSGFSDDDIVAMKKSIREEFEKRAEVKVTDVVMYRESTTKASGYVKLTLPIIGELTRGCTALMEEGSRKYFWRCE